MLSLSLDKRNVIRDTWNRFSGIPAGKLMFDRLIGLMVPYTGSIKAEVQTLQPGYAEVTLKDRRSVRNHLGSVHAIALLNLAEYAGNLAIQYALPDDARFIVAGLSARYLKKARGTITAKGHAPIPTTSERQEYEVQVMLYDESGDIVTEVTLQTLIGPKKKS